MCRMTARSSRDPAPRASDEFLEFTGSVQYDRRLWKHDIAGSIAHVHALAHAGVLTKGEKEELVSGLRAIARECHRGAVVFDPRLEDVHMNIERSSRSEWATPGRSCTLAGAGTTRSRST